MLVGWVALRTGLFVSYCSTKKKNNTMILLSVKKNYMDEKKMQT